MLLELDPDRKAGQPRFAGFLERRDDEELKADERRVVGDRDRRKPGTARIEDTLESVRMNCLGERKGAQVCISLRTYSLGGTD
jgi:hypothetical protein